MRDVIEATADLLARGERGAMATVLETSGSTPQSPGARLLLLGDGTTIGTVGGGAIEEAVINALKRCLEEASEGEVRHWDLGRDLGMCCGGRMRFFLEPLEAAPRLLLFGAGHVAQPTAAMARLAGFDVWVIDDRAELNTEARFPACTRIQAEPKEAAAMLSVRTSDWLLVCTHDHHLDEEALDYYARGPHRYLGMIGSKRKVLKIAARIRARGDLPPMDRVYSPVGLPIGAVSPAEIAASIVAELVAIRRGAEVSHMRLENLEPAPLSSVLEEVGSG